MYVFGLPYVVCGDFLTSDHGRQRGVLHVAVERVVSCLLKPDFHFPNRYFILRLNSDSGSLKQ